MAVDSFSIDRQVSDKLWMMVDFFTTSPFGECYLINTITGERQRLTFKDTIQSALAETVKERGV